MKQKASPLDLPLLESRRIPYVPHHATHPRSVITFIREYECNSFNVFFRHITIPLDLQVCFISQVRYYNNHALE